MKKITILLLAAAILAVGVGVSFAFFSDTEASDNNVIQSGSIRIRQLEEGVAGNGEALRPGQLNEKVVNVQNVGTNPAYVRTCIAIPAGNENVQWIELIYNENSSLWGWDVETVSIEGTKYFVYVGTYKPVLAPGATTAEPSMSGFYVSSAVDYDGTKYMYVENGRVTDLDLPADFKILIATEAVQTTYFGTQDGPLNEAYGDAGEALEAAFGEIKDGQHPWDERTYLDADTFTIVYGTTGSAEVTNP